MSEEPGTTGDDMAEKTIADELRVAYDERFWCGDLLKDAASVIDDLLAACEDTLAWALSTNDDGWGPPIDQLRAAIARAYPRQDKGA